MQRGIMGLIDNMVDALWSCVCVAADSLALNVPSSNARNSPDGTGGVVVVACIDDPFVFV
jgi:hypothetical protein